MKIRNSLIAISMIWIALAIFRTIYNVAKLPSEISVFQLSEEGKRENAYGGVVKLSNFIKNNTPDRSQVIFYTRNTDSKDFYLSRYLVYPRRLYLSTSKTQTKRLINSHKYLYLLSVGEEYLDYNNSKKFNNKIHLYKLP